MATKFESELVTAAEYGRLPDDGRLTDLVRGRIVEMNWPFTAHGYYVARISDLLTRFVFLVANDYKRKMKGLNNVDARIASWLRKSRAVSTFSAPSGKWPYV